MTKTYVLTLSDNKFYIGKTNFFSTRMIEHFQSKKAKWLQKHTPLAVKEIHEGDCEKALTLEYMAKYGVENVRGYTWCQVILQYNPLTYQKTT